MRMIPVPHVFALTLATVLPAPLTAQQLPALPDPASTMTTPAAAAVLQGIAACWVVDPGSAGADVVVTVAFSLDPDGRVAGEIDLVTHSDAPAAARDMAFDAARRAILRCQGSGFALPQDAYDSWKHVNMTFDPRELTVR